MWTAVAFALCVAVGVMSGPIDPTTQSIVITTMTTTPIPPYTTQVTTTTPPSPPSPPTTTTPLTTPPTMPTTTTTSVEETSRRVRITAFKVESKVSYRYAVTGVSSRVINPSEKPQTAAFSVVLPETAFISGFVMEIDGKQYKAHVKEKEEAKKEYHQAVSAGLAAGHVAVSARDSNKFTVDVSVPALKKATFNLTYEELLTRRFGVYDHVINLHPGQYVNDFSVDVYIEENKPIATLRVPQLRSGNEIEDSEGVSNSSLATIEQDPTSKNKAHVHFAPDRAQQKELMKLLNKNQKLASQKLDDKDGTGVNGQFVVQYDVERDPNSDEVMIYDGYFAHFFAPSELEPLPKHVTFVLDVSGSMTGRKIRQLREAMSAILSDLKPQDYFNIIEFSFSAKVWNLDDPSRSPIFVSDSAPTSWWYDPEKEPAFKGPAPAPYPANEKYIAKAKETVERLTADGGTNIYDSLKTAIEISNAGINIKNNDVQKPEPMIIFLTDGDPTYGETSIDKIHSMTKELNSREKRAVIYSLGFGEDADRGFLRKLSLRNGGFMRHIYEAADASKQLQNFYREVSSPLLSNVKFIYPKDQINEPSLTRHVFPILLGGCEIIVAGKLSQDTFTPSVLGDTRIGQREFVPHLIRPVVERDFAPLERMWAYLTIKQLLDDKDAELTSDTVEGAVSTEPQEKPEERALKIALKYSFVTPLTSLVVVKPNETNTAVNAETAAPGRGGSNGYALPLSLNAASFPVATRSFRKPASYSHHPLGTSLAPSFFQPTSGASGPISFHSYSGSRGGGAIAYGMKGMSFPMGSSSHFASSAVAYQPVSLLAGGPGRPSIPGIPGVPQHVAVASESAVAQASMDYDSDLYVPTEDRIVKGGAVVALTTTPKGPPVSSTTTVPTTTVPSITVPSAPPSLYQLYGWIAQYCTEINSQLVFKNPDTEETYRIEGAGLEKKLSCMTTRQSTPGQCVLLTECPGAARAITSWVDYSPLFCAQDGVAGICCDLSDQATTGSAEP